MIGDISKQACGKIAGLLSTKTNAMRLVVLPEFDVQNLVPTVYHLNYECNLTLYNMACEVLTYSAMAVAKHCWSSVISNPSSEQTPT